MRTLIFCVAVMAVIGLSAADWAEGTKPSFCKRSDCPEYEVIASTDEYEVRRYKSAKWISTSNTGTSYRDMKRKMTYSFWKLFYYIFGRNEQSMKIDMTSPVTTKIQLCTDETEDCSPSYERSFYIPPEHQDDAPNPSDSAVELRQWDEMTVFVRSFGGWANDKKYMSNLEDLVAAIGDPSLFDNSQYYQVGYDSPMTFWNRHNEIWLIATQQN